MGVLRTFLGQGLRSEAIHMADEQPNLMDLVAALDLPDPDAWAEFCQQSDLPVPPPLQMDRAAQLNEAYAQDQPMEHLLSRHRLLALSRAPIAQRLEVLRQMKADPELKKIPVVVLTSSREEADLVKSYELGTNAYVVKPVNFLRFMETVKELGMFWALINEAPPGTASRQP